MSTQDPLQRFISAANYLEEAARRFRENPSSSELDGELQNALGHYGEVDMAQATWVHWMDQRLIAYSEQPERFTQEEAVELLRWKAKRAQGASAIEAASSATGSTEREGGDTAESATAVIRRDAQEQPTEGKHPSSVKGIGVEGIDAIIREITEVLVCPGCGNEDEVRATCTICGCTGYDDERIEAIHLRLTALLSPDKA